MIVRISGMIDFCCKWKTKRVLHLCLALPLLSISTCVFNDLFPLGFQFFVHITHRNGRNEMIIHSQTFVVFS